MPHVNPDGSRSLRKYPLINVEPPGTYPNYGSSSSGDEQQVPIAKSCRKSGIKRDSSPAVEDKEQSPESPPPEYQGGELKIIFIAVSFYFL